MPCIRPKNRGRKPIAFLRARAFVSAVVLAFLLSALGAFPTAVGRDAVLIATGDKDYTVRDLTGITYGRGLAAAEAAYSRFGHRHRKTIGPIAFDPFTGAAPIADGGNPGKAYYLAGLHCVAVDFLRWQMVTLYIHKYNPNLGGYVHLGLVQGAVASQAAAAQTYFRFLARAAAEDLSPSAFYAGLAKRFPGKKFYGRENWELFWKGERQSAAAIVALPNCFPTCLRNGRPSQWYSDLFRSNIGEVAVGIVLNRDRPGYLKQLNAQYGSWHFVLVTDGDRAGLTQQEMKALKRSLTVCRWQHSPTAEALMASTLECLGASLRIGHGFGAAEYIKKIWGLGTAQLRPGAIIAASSVHTGGRVLIAIANRGYPHIFKGRNAWPGSFLFGECADSTLLPVARRLLKDTRLMQGVGPVNARFLANTMGVGRLSSPSGGGQPRIIYRVPWGVTQ